MKRLALFAAVIAISACSAKEQAPAADSAAAAAAPAPAPAPAMAAPAMDSAKPAMADSTKKDTTKKK